MRELTAPGGIPVSIPDDLPAPPAGVSPDAGQLTPLGFLGAGIDAAQAAARNVPIEVLASGARLLGIKDNMARARPLSAAGRSFSDDVSGAARNAVEPWMEAGGDALDATGVPGLRQDVGSLLRTAGDAANVFGTGALLSGGVRSRAATSSAREGLRTSAAVREAGSVAPVAKAAGFEVTPSAVGGSRSTRPTGMAATLEARGRNPEASLRNAQQFSKRIGDELNIEVGADGRLEPGAFEKARTPAFGVYDEARAFPGGPSAAYSDEVRRAIQTVDIPTDAAQEAARLMEKYSQVGDSARLVEDLKNLRRTASKRREGDTANQVANEALADVQMAIADALEDELGRRAVAVGDHGFATRLTDARKHLAQLYETERATSGGYVDLSQLAARQKKTGRMTGNLELGAQMGENLPDVFQHPQNAAPATMGRTPEAWGARSMLFRTAERLGGGMLSRRSMRKYNEAIPFGPGVLDDFQFSNFGDRGYFSPSGPNAGPQAPPSPSPGMFAADLAPPPAPPTTPSAGRIEPDFRRFTEGQRRFADDLAGDLTLEGAPPPAPAPRTPGGRPLDVLDFERGAPPAAPGQALPPLTQEQLRLAPDAPLGLVDERPLSLAALLDERVPLSAEGLGRGIDGSFAAQLGRPNFIDMPEAPVRGMPTRPRGVSGPLSAQLSDPRLPRGLELIDDTPPPQPQFGPVDEFTGFAGELSLAPESGGRPQFLEIDDLGVKPGADNVITAGPGTLAYNRRDGQRYIQKADVPEDQRGKGFGQQLLVNAAEDAAQAGEILNSDYMVTAAQLRAYEAAKSKGLITFEYTDPEIVAAALQSGGIAKLRAQPVVRNIRPTTGVAGLLGE